MALEHILSGLLEYATNEQGIKSITKALKEGGKDTLDRIIKRMCEPAKRRVPFLCSFASYLTSLYSARRAMIVDLALSATGSQLIASVLPNVSLVSLFSFFAVLIMLCLGRQRSARALV